MAGDDVRRHAKELVKELEALGYEFERVNAKSMHVYARDGAEILVSPGVDENAARQILRRVRRDLGCTEEVAKRKPAQIKERQAAERENAQQAIARLAKERSELLARKDAALAGRFGLAASEAREIERLIESNDRERREWERLMTRTPSSADHRGTGRARHRAGGAA